MATTTTRTGDMGQNFTEIHVGETPNSIEVATNAKGAAQLTIKLYFATPEELATQADVLLANIIIGVKEHLDGLGIPLAGQNGASGALEGK